MLNLRVRAFLITIIGTLVLSFYATQLDAVKLGWSIEHRFVITFALWVATVFIAVTLWFGD